MASRNACTGLNSYGQLLVDNLILNLNINVNLRLTLKATR